MDKACHLHVVKGRVSWVLLFTVALYTYTLYTYKSDLCVGAGHEL